MHYQNKQVYATQRQTCPTYRVRSPNMFHTFSGLPYILFETNNSIDNSSQTGIHWHLTTCIILPCSWNNMMTRQSGIYLCLLSAGGRLADMLNARWTLSFIFQVFYIFHLCLAVWLMEHIRLAKCTAIQKSDRSILNCNFFQSNHMRCQPCVANKRVRSYTCDLLSKLLRYHFNLINLTQTFGQGCYRLSTWT